MINSYDLILCALRVVGVLSVVGLLIVVIMVVTTLRGIGRGPWGLA